MRIDNIHYLTLVIITVLTLMPLYTYSNAQEDDAIGVEDFTTENVEPINEMTVPNVLYDFDELPQGPTSLEAILGAFPDSCLTGLTFVTRAGTGNYNVTTGGGRALAANPNGTGSLYLVDPLGNFGNADALLINMKAFVTQFGFEIGDYISDINAELYNKGNLIGIITVDADSNNRTHIFESDILFNQVVLTVLPQNPLANWVVPSLRVPVCFSNLELTLAPTEAINPVGTDHTVTATIEDNGVPIAGFLVSFEVISGPNAGIMSIPNNGECTPNDNCITDANGQVSWTYTGINKLGTDAIVASIGVLESAPVEKTWVGFPIPTLSEWGLIALAGVLGIIGLLALRRRKATA